MQEEGKAPAQAQLLLQFPEPDSHLKGQVKGRGRAPCTLAYLGLRRARKTCRLTRDFTRHILTLSQKQLFITKLHLEESLHIQKF